MTSTAQATTSAGIASVVRPLAKRKATLYARAVIRSFIHKGLENLFLTGSKAGIQAAHASKIGRLLARLDQAAAPRDMNLPGWRLHEPKGAMAGHWSVTVNGNWRITFRFADGDAEVVDYLDYH